MWSSWTHADGSTHIAQGHDFQVRAQWKPNTVVLWDSELLAIRRGVELTRRPGHRSQCYW
jgi:hypothetical protein